MKTVRADSHYMGLALALARRGYGSTSPNPMVGAVLVKGGRIIGRGWHRRAGQPHAEIEALGSAQQFGYPSRGATLYVTLEPCSTHGRTPPCTAAIIAAGIRSVIAGATDPNPRHKGKGFELLKAAGIKVTHGVLGQECECLNEAFNHWIVRHTPFVLVKAAMTVDGKIATVSGESKWITGEAARAYAMHLRRGADAVLVGINTILADDPSLTIREPSHPAFLPLPLLIWRRRKAFLESIKAGSPSRAAGSSPSPPEMMVGERKPSSIQHPASSIQHPASSPRRLVLDTYARTPLTAKIVTDDHAAFTSIIVTEFAPKNRVKALGRRVGILVAPALEQPRDVSLAAGKLRRTNGGTRNPKPTLRVDLRWVLKTLGAQNVTQLLVEGGGEVNASFLMQGLGQRIAFFYAPKILGGRNSRTAVAGDGVNSLRDAIQTTDLAWVNLGPDWLLTARV